MPEAVGTELHFAHPVPQLVGEYLTGQAHQPKDLQFLQKIASNTAGLATIVLRDYRAPDHTDEILAKVDTFFQELAHLRVDHPTNVVDLVAYIIDRDDPYFEGFEERDKRYLLDSAIERQIAKIQNRGHQDQAAFFHYGEDFMDEREFGEGIRERARKVQDLKNFQHRVRELQEESSSSQPERR